jgi:hypothetical protein
MGPHDENSRRDTRRESHFSLLETKQKRCGLTGKTRSAILPEAIDFQQVFHIPAGEGGVGFSQSHSSRIRAVTRSKRFASRSHLSFPA